MTRLRALRPSAALVVSFVALIVAISGTSYAAFTLPRNSVGTRQLKNKSVTPAKVAPSTIALFKGEKGDAGVQGPGGPQGPQGRQGIKGPPGPGATTFAMTLPPGTTTLTGLAQVGNGVTITGACENAGEPRVGLSVATNDAVNYVGEFTRSNTDNDVVKVTDTLTNPFSLVDTNEVLISGLVRDVSNLGTNSTFARIDVTGVTGNPCSFQGMIIPSG
jgi:hypothetical protein